ncbi:MAG TPA: hypothetical protein VFT06_10240 [Flavisolibacter sp.]|nr:hypothetical protein [Flavisolibacter sp.]
MSFSFDIKGLDKVQKALKEHPVKARKAIHAVLVEEVTNINRQQVQAASRFTDRAQLIKGISWAAVDELNFVLFSQAPYSAYLEFGTRKKFTPIAGIDAGEYRGSGGSTGKLYDAILAWVKRKGIAHGTTFSVRTRRKKGGKAQDKAERAAAFAIMKSIMVNGVNPQPFFFAPFLSRREQLKNAVQQALNNL